MRIRYVSIVCALLVVLFANPISAVRADEARIMAPPERAFSAHSADPARRFDFWLGTWDVALRIRNDEGEWPIRVNSKARIYQILGGRAILELWDSDPIKGMSLRYYDAEHGKWQLWLNWPRQNFSRTGHLEGNFTFGRGDFFAEQTNAEGETILARYSFNDITPFSLRWDDAYSKDGGKTWSENWRMQFTRTGLAPQWPIPRDAVPTWTDGSRCTDEAFHAYDGLGGDWQGMITGRGRVRRAEVSAYRILDGCAVIAFIEGVNHGWFILATYNTPRQAWETDVLSRDPAEQLMQFFSADDATNLAGDAGKVTWQIGDDVVWNLDTGDGTPVSVRFRPAE